MANRDTFEPTEVDPRYVDREPRSDLAHAVNEPTSYGKQFDSLRPNTWSLGSPSGLLVTIDTKTGQIEYGPNYSPDAAAKVFWEAIGGRITGGQFDFLHHIYRQISHSVKTFGPGRRTMSISDHIRKELVEIETKPNDLEEWIDVIILAIDGAWRTGASAEDIVAALVAKQTKNEVRKWPDWRLSDPNKAIEHDRSAE